MTLPPHPLLKKQVVQIALFLTEGQPSTMELAEIANCRRSYVTHIKGDFDPENLDIDTSQTGSSKQAIEKLVRTLEKRGYDIHETRATQLGIEYPVKQKSEVSEEVRDDWYLTLATVARELNMMSAELDELISQYSNSDAIQQTEIIEYVNEIKQHIETEKTEVQDLSNKVVPTRKSEVQISR